MRPDPLAHYLQSGDAVFTLRSKRTGTEFSLRVLRRDADHLVTVGQRSGSCAARGFTEHARLGRVVNGRLYLLPVPAEHAQAQATLSWFWPRALIAPETVLAQCEVLPDDFCSCCGRRCVGEGLCTGCVRAMHPPPEKWQPKCYDTHQPHYALAGEVDVTPDALLLAMGE